MDQDGTGGERTRPPCGTAGPRRRRGFSLVEVILALGLLAGILLSIGTMFVLGGRQVASARRQTQATAIARDILESQKNRSFTGLYTAAGATPADRRATVTSVRPGSVIPPWQPRIAGLLGDGAATLTIEPLGPGAPDFGAAHGLRLVVSVNWNEAGRGRAVTIATARF